MVAIQEKLVWPSTWEEAEAFARRLTDGMGCPIDEGILETVVALNLLGFPTVQSCEGHLEDGLPYPWVDFETDEFPTFKQALEEASHEGLSIEEREAKGAQLVAIAEALPSRGILYSRLEEMVNRFYQRYPSVPEEQRIVIYWGSPILFRLMPFYGHWYAEWSETERKENLACAKAEMQAFTAFLKQQISSQRGLACRAG